MNRRLQSVWRLLGGALVVAVLLAGCGEADQAGAIGNNPDQPVSNTPGSPDPDPSPTTPTRKGAQITEPRPGMADVRPREWTRAEKGRNERVLWIYFWSGVEPCYVLDRVEVQEKKDSVTVTLFEGHDPDAEDQACIEIALKKVVKVTLDEPLGDRRIVDGAR